MANKLSTDEDEDEDPRFLSFFLEVCLEAPFFTACLPRPMCNSKQQPGLSRKAPEKLTRRRKQTLQTGQKPAEMKLQLPQLRMLCKQLTGRPSAQAGRRTPGQFSRHRDMGSKVSRAATNPRFSSIRHDACHPNLTCQQLASSVSAHRTGTNMSACLKKQPNPVPGSSWIANFPASPRSQTSTTPANKQRQPSF